MGRSTAVAGAGEPSGGEHAATLAAHRIRCYLSRMPTDCRRNADADSVHALVAAAAGVATGVYPRDARAELLAEWPE